MLKTQYSLYKKQAVQEWLSVVYSTYPLETTGFMRAQQNKFSNPVGYAIQLAAEHLYDVIVGELTDADKTGEVLSDLIKIRAVQNFNPEQAVGIILLYKPIVKKLFLKKSDETLSLQEYFDAESRIDSLSLIAFSYYVKERELVYEQRALELKRQSRQLQRWASSHNYPVTNTP